jgi:diadenosine tetraphosphatase ApaH/serine/threonine PP2A family protein phosphatase
MDVPSIWQDPERVRFLEEEEVAGLLEGALGLLRKETNLLRIDRGKTLFVGDTHGNFEVTKAVMRIFSLGGFDRIVFLGDYVDRGNEQVENINCVISLKLEKPERVFLLRGNHETVSANSRYGFREAVTSRYSRKSYEMYNRVFAYLPLAATTWDGLFAVHGGMARGLRSMVDIDDLPRGDVEPIDDLVLQLLWNDPAEGVDGFAFNDQRGGYYYYGRGACLKFLEDNKQRMLLRSHEVFADGYNYFFDGRLLSIFSSTGYCGSPIRGKAAQLSSDGRIDLIDIAI